MITKLFRPFPGILRKDYIFHLFYHKINPYSFYPEEDFPVLDKLHHELKSLLDVYQPYMELVVFPEYGQSIKAENPELFYNLEEKVNNSNLFSEIVINVNQEQISKIKKSNIYNYI